MSAPTGTGLRIKPLLDGARLTGNEWPVGSGVMRRPLVPPPDRPNPTGPRRCGGPEHSAGLELEILWRARAAPLALGRVFHAPAKNTATDREINNLGCEL